MSITLERAVQFIKDMKLPPDDEAAALGLMKQSYLYNDPWRAVEEARVLTNALELAKKIRKAWREEYERLKASRADDDA